MKNLFNDKIISKLFNQNLLFYRKCLFYKYWTDHNGDWYFDIYFKKIFKCCKLGLKNRNFKSSFLKHTHKCYYFIFGVCQRFT